MAKQKQHQATGTKMVQARLPADLAKRIKRHCVDTDTTLAAFMATALRMALVPEREETP